MVLKSAHGRLRQRRMILEAVFLVLDLDCGKRDVLFFLTSSIKERMLCATEVTFGFDTALHTATDAIDKIHTTAESHHRIMVVEVMGRDAGWIAIEAGIAGGAHIILIPEIGFTVQKICDHVDKRERYGKRFTIVVVAEGVQLPPR